ncbi:hypothetical protein PXNS11_290107 [Stutzerimonas xanthomarina]|nr:hypothetical protein PXNS11_290107 [Stutzerimonas xanthomarina]
MGTLGRKQDFTGMRRNGRLLDEYEPAGSGPFRKLPAHPLQARSSFPLQRA